MSKKEIIILGLDPGLGTTGFGLIKSNGRKHLFLEAGVIKTLPTDQLGQRLLIIYQKLLAIIKEHQPQCVAMESLFFARNTTSAFKVAQAQGVFNLICFQQKLPLFEYTPLRMKMQLTGYGRAQKKEIQTEVQKLLNLPKPPRPVDSADALGIALTHSFQLWRILQICFLAFLLSKKVKLCYYELYE